MLCPDVTTYVFLRLFLAVRLLFLVRCPRHGRLCTSKASVGNYSVEGKLSMTENSWR